MLVKAVIFDMDGTVFDTERLSWNVFSRVMQEYGYEADLEDFVFKYMGGLIDQITSHIKNRFGQDIPAEEIWLKKRKLQDEEIKNNGVGVKYGIPELLKFLNDKNIPCILASSTDYGRIMQRMQISGLGHFFKDIVSGDMVKNGKPDPEIFLKACKCIGVQPEEAIVIEDSTNGVLAGLNANIPTVSILDLLPLKEDLQKRCVTVFKDGFDGIEWFKTNTQMGD